ncbi:MAG: TfoX/Sxy family protein [Rhodobacteraceae bacterium]|nr:TfoX/Sxy family protein [Paracoccaceae bacterium]
MSVTDADIAFALDLFAPLGTLTHRKMMGGLTIYCDGQIFAILGSDGQVYLKAKGAFAAAMEDAGARQFSMVSDAGKTSSMGYWTLPDAALDDPEAACDWARRALDSL